MNHSFQWQCLRWCIIGMILGSICIHIVQIAATPNETAVLLKNDSTAMTDVGGPDH